MSEDEHAWLVNVLGVTVRSEDVAKNVALLPILQQELESEGKACLLSMDIVDRILMERLPLGGEEPTAPTDPVAYLLGCYKRATGTALDGQDVKPLCTQLVNFTSTWLVLSEDVAPERSRTRGRLQLLDAACVAANTADALGTHVPPDMPGLPQGFMTAFCDSMPEDFQQAMEVILQELTRIATRMSALGKVRELHSLWAVLLESKPVIKTVLHCRAFGAEPPENCNGRQFQNQSALAALMSISHAPDQGATEPPAPDVVAELWARTMHKTGVLQPTEATIQEAWMLLQPHMHSLMLLFNPKVFLSKDCRERTLEWVAAALNCNGERAKVVMQLERASSNGCMLNLCHVLLELCRPFIDYHSAKGLAKSFIDIQYLAGTGRLSYDSEARMSADHVAVRAWQDSVRQEGTAKGTFHFITECFFLTARCLSLSVIKTTDLIQEDVQNFKDVQASEGEEGNAEYKLRMKNQLGANIYSAHCYLAGPSLGPLLLDWAQLMSAWLLTAAAGKEPQHAMLPLPAEPPQVFRIIPTAFLLDACKILRYWYRFDAWWHIELPHLRDFVLLATALLPATAYVENPFVRLHMVYVLMDWPPGTPASDLVERKAQQGKPRPNVDGVFADARVQQNLVPGLMQLYCDFERVGEQEADQKYHARMRVAGLLTYLRHERGHDGAWEQLALNGAPLGVHARFLDTVLNDSVTILDHAINRLPMLKSRVEEMRTAPAGLQERLEIDIERITHYLKGFFEVGDAFVSLMALLAKDLGAAFLVPELVTRVAEMLNYFLRHLTGPDRSKLKVPNLERIQFNPRQLLAQILKLFIHLRAMDKNNRFVQAIAEDGRSYRPENFTEAVHIAQDVGLPDFSGQYLGALERLADDVQAAAVQAQKEEAAAENAPAEFLDIVTAKIMRDPVQLPSGHFMDRDNVLRSLMSDARDPVSRAPMQVSDLVDATELRDQIQHWKQTNLG